MMRTFGPRSNGSDGHRSPETRDAAAPVADDELRSDPKESQQ
jgi:hypothetical protein